MISHISREEILKNSVSADTTIADLQKAFAKNFDLDDPEDASLLKNLYDHTHPFNSIEGKKYEHVVLALPSKSKESFENAFPERLVKFFQLLDIHELYLMDWLKRSWNEFPFENPSKKDKFQKLVGDINFSGGFKVKINQLKTILSSLFFSSRFDQPVFYLFPGGEDHYSFYLCDDGNIHINYTAEKSQLIKRATEEAGFITGDIEICQVFYARR